jgi:GTP-binding protein
VSRSLPVIAVIGRPNVGKSTFFNRLLGKRIAIVDDRPGVTRDRNFGLADWAGRSFMIVDTGGVVEGSNEPLDQLVREQALAAIAEADLILFLVDAKTGVHPLDQALSELLRTADTPVLVVANKVDNYPSSTAHLDFWELGLGEPLPVSALSGRGSGDLLDRVVECLPEAQDEPETPESDIRVAVIGKPNVGKSSLINRLFGETRVVVSATPGTTRDPVDSTLRFHGRVLTVVDTAGLRRQSRIKDSLEYYSALRTERVVREADVCVLVVDAADGLHTQDLKIAEAAWDAGCGLVLLANKWDVVEKDTGTAPAFEKALHEKAPDFRWVPVLFVSALTGQRVRKVLEQIVEVYEARRWRIPTSDLNRALEQAVRKQPPPHHRGRPVKLKYATQASIEPPTIVVFANYPKAVPDHYIRYMHNTFRSHWPFMGVPLRIRMRQSRSE